MKATHLSEIFIHKLLPCFTMKLSLPLFTLALVPSLALGAIFPPNSHVKMLDPQSFKKALKANVRRSAGLS